MRNRRNKRTSNKKTKTIKITAYLCVIICLIFISVIFSLANSTNSKIISGVKVEGVNLSGMSQEEAKEKLQQWYDDVAMKNITLNYEDIEENIDIIEFNPESNIDKAVSEALKVGRNGNILTNNYAILFTMLFHKNIDIDIKYDEEKIDNRIKEVGGKLPDAVIQNSYYIEGEELIIKKGSSGTVVQADKLKDLIKTTIKNEGNKTITIPTNTVEPDELTIEQIHKEVYREAQDAYIEEKPVKVIPQVDGIDFAISMDEAKALLEEDKDECVIPLKITEPEVTLDVLGQNAFPEVLGEFTTRYEASNVNRSTNISLASEKISGTIIKPGETFSYNRIVGERTIAKGYKEATVYSGGKVVQGIGGGICQLSSTLYNAALYANLNITQRSNHRFLTSYVQAGRDATVSWGTIDLCFVNTRKYPIQIICTAKNGLLKVQICGIKEEEEYDVSLQTEILEERDYKTSYIDDWTMNEGEEYLQQYGSKGVKSQTYKIVKLNGQTVSKTLLSTDTYSSLEEIIKRGKKKVDASENQNTINENTENVQENKFTYPVVQEGGSIWGSTTGID